MQAHSVDHAWWVLPAETPEHTHLQSCMRTRGSEGLVTYRYKHAYMHARAQSMRTDPHSQCGLLSSSTNLMIILFLECCESASRIRMYMNLHTRLMFRRQDMIGGAKEGENASLTAPLRYQALQLYTWGRWIRALASLHIINHYKWHNEDTSMTARLRA